MLAQVRVVPEFAVIVGGEALKAHVGSEFTRLAEHVAFVPPLEPLQDRGVEPHRVGKVGLAGTAVSVVQRVSVP